MMSADLYLLVYKLFAFLTTCIYFGLGISAITTNPRRGISWAFGGYSLVVAAYFCTSLFLLPDQYSLPLLETPPALRWKWFFVCLGPAFFYHVAYYYFPPGWQKRGKITLILVYTVSFLLAPNAFLNDLLIAGPVVNSPSEVIAPQPGLLMYILSFFLILIVTSALVRFLITLKRSKSVLVQQQIRGLLLPTALILFDIIIKILYFAPMPMGIVFHWLGDIAILSTAYFFTQAVLRYGTITGQTGSGKTTVHFILFVTFFFMILYVGLQLDNITDVDTRIGLPIFTTILVICAVVSYPLLNRWLNNTLDPFLFPKTMQREKASLLLVKSLENPINPDYLIIALLEQIKSSVGAIGTGLALPTPDGSQNLQLYRKSGNLILQEGDQIPWPAGLSQGVRRIAQLQPGSTRLDEFADIKLIAALDLGDEKKGLLLVAPPLAGNEYRPPDLQICTDLALRLQAAVSMLNVENERLALLQTAQEKSQVLRHLATEASGAGSEIIDEPSTPTKVEIYTFGGLRVVTNGTPVSGSTWGSERTRQLLGYLILHDEAGCSRDYLVSSLWPDSSEADASNNLYVALHHLRHVFEPKLPQRAGSTYVLKERNRYRLGNQASLWVDARQFNELVQSGNPENLSAAVELYQGVFLKDISYQFNIKELVIINDYERRYIRALRSLLATQAGVDNPAPYLERLLAVEPGDISAHRQLTEHYLSTGRPDMAYRQIQDWQEAMDFIDQKIGPQDYDLWQRVEDLNQWNQEE